MTRVLVTNDDGIDAPGLHALATAAVEAGLDVVIAAPVRQSSGASASIMASEADGRITVKRRTLPDLEDIPAFAVDGGPGLIALIAARGAFGERPDVVMSGINHGANVGRAILHSGTVGAALTGGLHGAWGIAVSLDVGLTPTEFHWGSAAAVAIELIPVVTALSQGAVLNVNVPNRGDHRGMVEAGLAPFGIVQTTLSEKDEHYIRLAVEDLPRAPQPGSDAAKLSQGLVTVSALNSVSSTNLGLFD